MEEDNERLLLSKAGLDTSWLSQEQRTVIAGLSSEEIAMLISIKQRLDSVAPAVETHFIGGILW
jgi:hypothetical protein